MDDLDQMLDQLVHAGSNSFWSILLAVFIVIASVFAARYARRVIRRKFRAYEGIDEYAGGLIGRVTGWVVVLLGVVLALVVLGVDMVPVVLVLLLVFAFLALSGRSLVENWAAGLLLQARAPYYPGDRIQTGDFVGDVELTSVRSVVLRQGDGQVVHIPNIEVLQNPLVNQTGDEAGRRSSLKFGVAYDAAIDEAERILTEAAASVAGVREHPAPSAWIASLGDSAIDLELRFWTNYSSRHTVPSAVAVEALKRLDAADVTMPLPTQQVVITGEKDE